MGTVGWENICHEIELVLNLANFVNNMLGLAELAFECKHLSNMCCLQCLVTSKTWQMVTIRFYEIDAFRDGQRYSNKEDEYNILIPFGAFSLPQQSVNPYHS